MKILTQKSEVWGECPSTFDEAVLHIERAGRTCYLSEDKIVEGSGKTFVHNIIKRGHLSVIEHSNMVVRSKYSTGDEEKELRRTRAEYHSPFLTSIAHKGYIYTGGNFRAWMEQLELDSIEDLYGFHDDLIVPNDKIPTPLKMITVEFLTDRAVTHELVRHRPAAYSQESQRYCAYKMHLEVILPWYYADIPNTKDPDTIAAYQRWVQAMEYAELQYQRLMNKSKERPEQARSVLPNSTATKIVMTASVSEWMHVFKMRCSKAAYPGIRGMMTLVDQEFVSEGWTI